MTFFQKAIFALFIVVAAVLAGQVDDTSSYSFGNLAAAMVMAWYAANMLPDAEDGDR